MADLLSAFRVEGRETIASLTRELLALEKAPGDPQALATCLRLAHNLKGTARVVQQFGIGDMAHTLEEALLPLRNGQEQAESEYFSDLLRIVARMRESLDRLDEELQAGRAAEGRAKTQQVTTDGELFDTVRVNISEMDRLLEGLSEAAIQLGPLRAVEDSLHDAAQTLTSLQASLHSGKVGDQALLWGRFRSTVDALTTTVVQAGQTMAPSLSRLEQELETVRERASTLRLLPVRSIFGTLELTMRDAAGLLGKAVQFEVSGGDVSLEGHILLSVRDALLHVIRNAVDHGLESPGEREFVKKPAVGTISLNVVRHGRRVEFRCRDDGRGIDPEKVRATILASGRLAREKVAALTSDELFAFLFETGVSTADRVTEISGRGVGLDVVRAVANRLRGQASIESELGRGTTITIDVPMSLSAMKVLSVSVGRDTVLIPLDAVRHTLRLQHGEIVRNSEGESILYEDGAIPFVELRSVIGSSPTPERRATWTVIVVQAGSKVFALGADALLETLDIVVKPLPAGVDAPPSIAGAAFDSKGDPVLVLEPMGLHAIRPEVIRTEARPAAASPQRLPILVIDDSLTTRMLEQSILEAAGYVVDLSASAEDALRRAQAKKYGLFIVDVEMPGMNGYEFTRITRADPHFASIPVIMVTSLATADDRQRGLDAGASAYIVKGDFDQKYFVDKVAELLGAP